MKQIPLIFSFLFATGLQAQTGKLSGSFIENFNEPVLHDFRYGSTGTKEAFK